MDLLSKISQRNTNTVYYYFYIKSKKKKKKNDITETETDLQIYRREWQPRPVFLPGEFHEQRNLVSYSPQGCKESDTTERLTHTHITN